MLVIIVWWVWEWECGFNEVAVNRGEKCRMILLDIVYHLCNLRWYSFRLLRKFSCNYFLFYIMTLYLVDLGLYKIINQSETKLYTYAWKSSNIQYSKPLMFYYRNFKQGSLCLSSFIFKKKLKPLQSKKWRRKLVFYSSLPTNTYSAGIFLSTKCELYPQTPRAIIMPVCLTSY